MKNYRRYIGEFLALSTMMTAALYFLNQDDLKSALFIGVGASLLTVINKYFLDKKTLKKKNETKA